MSSFNTNDRDIYGTDRFEGTEVGGFVVTPMRAEELVQSLRVFKVEEVGSFAWMEQHRHIERLNIQAHQCAMNNSDDFVTEAILTYQKLGVLIEELIVIESWKRFAFSKISDQIAHKNSMRLYFVLYHEATLTNLLEVMLYYRHVVESLDSEKEKWIELVDYIAAKLHYLNDPNSAFRTISPSNGSGSSGSSSSSSASDKAKGIAESIANRSPQEELQVQFHEIEFRVCISACFLLRFLCEHIQSLPVSVHSRLSDTHDVLVLIVPLIENPPWTRRISETKKWQKVIDYKWTEVPPIDLLKVTKLEGQLWITLYYLVSRPAFRERYQLNSYRTQQLLRIRKYINEILVDQLPMLADIQRYMDELIVSDATGGTNSKAMLDAATLSANRFTLFQEVAIIRDRLAKCNWDKIVEHQVQNVFIMTDATDKDLKLLADVYADDAAEDVLEPLPKGPEDDYEDI